MMSRNIALFTISSFLFSMAACGEKDGDTYEDIADDSSLYTASTCQALASEDCGDCLSTGTYICSSQIASYYYPEYNQDGQMENTCSDGGSLLDAYNEGWVARGCCIDPDDCDQ